MSDICNYNFIFGIKKLVIFKIARHKKVGSGGNCGV